MQVLKHHKKVILIALVLVVILLVSFFVVQNTSKPSPTHTPSPKATPVATQGPQLFPGEVTQYQNQSLTPIYVYLEDLTQHPDVSIGGTQNINKATYHLAVTDLVNQSLEYTYDDVVNNFTEYQQVSTLLCVEGWSVTCLWQGVRVSDLLKEAGVSPNANTLIFSASDGYTTAIPLSYQCRTT